MSEPNEVECPYCQADAVAEAPDFKTGECWNCGQWFDLSAELSSKQTTRTLQNPMSEKVHSADSTTLWGWAVDADGQLESITFGDALEAAEKGLMQLHTSWEDLASRAKRGEFRSMVESIFWDMIKDLSA